MTDEELIRQLFEPVKGMTVSDDGFTERVMHRLPNRRTVVLSRLWTVLCVTVGVVLFITLNGWQLIADSLMLLVSHPPTEQQLLTLIVTAAVTIVVIISEVVPISKLLAQG